MESNSNHLLVGGQGIASGFRDAISLAWRLALLCRYHDPELKTHQAVLEKWYEERKQQLDQSLAATIQNGKFVTEGHRALIFLRSWYFWLVQMIPSWKREAELGQRKDGIFRYTYSAGMPFIPELNGGLNVPQVYCRSMTGEIHFTDDIFFKPQMKGLFRMLVYLKNSIELESARETLRKVEDWSQGELIANEIPVIVEEMQSGKETIENSNVYQLATGQEFARSHLCDRRPEPIGYDQYLLRDNIKGKFVIMRPDRFIYATCSEETELKNAVGCMMDVLRGR